jgi:TM2 domain-containing membrane protein YozV
MSNDTPAIAPPAAPQVVHHHYHPQKSAGIAALLEVLPAFFQIFGLGHIYAGRVVTGLVFMFGYWAVAAVNFLLLFVLIGYITWPLCWIATVVVSSLLAARAARTANEHTDAQVHGR